MESFTIQMDPSMMGTGTMIAKTDQGKNYSKMGLCMMDSGKMIECTEEEFLFQATEIDMKGSFPTVLKMDTV